MNTQISKLTRRQSRGFSLIELLVVVSIIVILAAIVIGALQKVKIAQNIKLTKTRLKNIALKLEVYANENQGVYPVGEDASSAILYNVLSGDFTGQGQEPTGEVYWKELTRVDPNLVGESNNRKVIIDGFLQPYRYLSALDIDGREVENVKNDGSYDLWSVGPDGEPKDLNTNPNVENEQTKDDIWN